MKIFLSVIALLLFLVPTAYAQDLSDVWCDALADEQEYELGNMLNYKMFVQGDDGWVFRSKTGFKDGFFVSGRTQFYLKTLQQQFKAHGTDLVILYPPPRSILYYQYVKEADRKALNFDSAQAEKAMKHYARFLTDMQKEGINIVGLPDPDPKQQMFFKRDHHWTPEGAKAGAEAVAAFAKTLPVYEALEKTEFETLKGESEDYRGSFKNVFTKLCNTVMPPEPRIKYETQAKASTSSEDALFGNTSAPEVVLLGTSNSSAKSDVANFEGFLKDALDVDIENLAVTGAGVDTSLIGYLNSARAKTNPAKLVIWEVPGYYNFDFMRRDVFLQAIPALQGPCVDDALAVNEGFQVTSPNEYALFEGVKEMDLSDGRYYLYFKFDRPVTSKFFTAVEYDIFKDIHPFERSPRYPAPDGEYYFWIEQETRGAPKEIYFKAEDASMAGANGKVYLCRLHLETQH